MDSNKEKDQVFDPTKPIKTRGGRKARIICTDAWSKGVKHIVALVSVEPGHESLIFYDQQGKYDAQGREGPNDYRDLVNVPEETHQGFLNIYRIEGKACGVLHETQEDADFFDGGDREACIPIEWRAVK